VSILKELAGDPRWIGLIKAAEKMRPDVPAWNPAEANVEDWKHKSAMRDGFDLCLQIFTEVKK
jgi:hypothetical protein